MLAYLRRYTAAVVEVAAVFLVLAMVAVVAVAAATHQELLGLVCGLLVGL